MLAARHGQSTAISLLLTLPDPSSIYKADINGQDLKGDTALHHASSYGHLKVMHTLIGHGADPWVRNHFFWTPVDYSATFQTEAYLRDLANDMERRRLAGGSSTGGRDVGDHASSTRRLEPGIGDGTLMSRGGVRLVPISSDSMTVGSGNSTGTGTGTGIGIGHGPGPRGDDGRKRSSVDAQDSSLDDEWTHPNAVVVSPTKSPSRRVIPSPGGGGRREAGGGGGGGGGGPVGVPHH